MIKRAKLLTAIVATVLAQQVIAHMDAGAIPKTPDISVSLAENWAT